MKNTPPIPDDRRSLSRETPRFWRIWWPALAAAGVALAGLGTVVVQQAQIHSLQGEVDSLRQQLDELKAAPAGGSPVMSRPGTLHRPAETRQPKGREELEALRSQATGLKAEVARLESLDGEARTLQRELANLARQAMPQEFSALEEAREKAQRIKCVNNLKQIGLAARIFATDHNDVLPPDFVSIANELSTPTILHCPSDTARSVADSWENFTMANCSYELLAPSGSDTEPNRVLAKCRIHGTVCLCDGSVQQLTPEQQARQLQWRGGKLWMNSGAQTGQAPQMDEMMMRRYGLTPEMIQQQQQQHPGTAPQMDELMMRRYGLLPPETDAPAEEEQP